MACNHLESGHFVDNILMSAAAGHAAACSTAGAKVILTAIGQGRLAVTIEAGGTVEVRTFDLKTLQPVGRLRIAPSP
jgi:hypothetical protein